MQESQPPDSTPGLNEPPNFRVEGVISYLHSSTEQEKAALARHLHDDLGGLMVGALMDIAWAEQHLSAVATECQEKLSRARNSLRCAIDLKRRVIEELRPTLLDNVGLIPALRWQVKDSWGGAGLSYTQTYPAAEPTFRDGAAIDLFRIAQEGLSLIMAHQGVTSADFIMEIDADMLRMVFSSDGKYAEGSPGSLSQAHISLNYRIRRLAGEMRLSTAENGRATVTVSIPLRILASHSL